MNTHHTDGNLLHGGHLMRIEGSRHLARLGVPREIIKRLARWGSGMIDRYIKDVSSIVRLMTIIAATIIVSCKIPTTILKT